MFFGNDPSRLERKGKGEPRDLFNVKLRFSLISNTDHAMAAFLYFLMFKLKLIMEIVPLSLQTYLPRVRGVPTPLFSALGRTNTPGLLCQNKTHKTAVLR